MDHFELIKVNGYLQRLISGLSLNSGSAFIHAILQKGFDERHAYIGGMFGAGEFSIFSYVWFCSVNLRFAATNQMED